MGDTPPFWSQKPESGWRISDTEKPLNSGTYTCLSANPSPGTIRWLYDALIRPESFSVIGMAGEHLLGAVKLLQQHAARQKMRPGHLAKRQYRVGAVEDFGTEAVGAADRKGECCDTPAAPCGELVRKTAARPHGAALVEGDQPRPGRQ
jgi:hypothetical protein